MNKVLLFIGIIGFAAMAVVAGGWWAIDKFELLNGLIFLALMWASTFDFVFIKDRKCLQSPIERYYFLPLTIIASVGFAYGAIIHI